MEKQKPKAGPLCEDANALEVRNEETGETKVVKTADRNQTAKDLKESSGPEKPAHAAW